MKVTGLRMYGVNDLRVETFDLRDITDDEILVKIYTDSLCMSSYKAAIQGSKHKRVPDDISIIGYDGLKIGSFYTPKLTTIAQHVELLARRGFDILMRCMEQGAPARHVTVPFTLSVRESVRNITE